MQRRRERPPAKETPEMQADGTGENRYDILSQTVKEAG